MSDINITIRLASKAATDGMDRFGGAAQKASQKLTLFQKVSRQASRSLDSFYGNLGANLAFRAFNVITTGLANTVNNVRAFETALVGVGKTTGLSGKALEDLGLRIQDLSKEIPVAATELLDLGKTAAQLGVEGSDNILKFTETMARLATATDIVGEQGAIAFARIINVTGESVGNIDRLGSSIVTLGNNFAATESQILAVSNEVAKGGARFGLTAEQVLGLSTAMAALGVESQVAGSTTQKVFSLVEKAIGQGGAELEKFTKVLGLNRKEFISLFKTNPQEFFIKLVEGLKRTQGEGKNLSSSLAELGFQDLRVTKTLGPLIDRVDLLRDATKLSSDAFIENRALIEESEAAFATLDGDIQLLENSWIALTNTLLKAVLPSIKAVVQGITSIIDVIQESVVVQGVLLGLTAAVAANFLSLTLASLRLVAAKAVLVIGINGVSASLVLAARAAAGFWLNLLGPVGLVIAGITAVSFVVSEFIDSQEKAERATDGVNTVLVTQTANQRALNKQLKDSIDLQTGLNGLFGEERGQGTVLQTDGQAAAREKARKEKEAEDRAEKEKELQDLKLFGEQKNALLLEQKRAEFLADDELAAGRDEFLLQQEADKLAAKLESRKTALALELGLDEEANKLRIEGQKKSNAREIAQAKASNDAKLKIEKTLATQKNSIIGASFDLGAALAKDGSKAQFLIQKAAALAEIALARGKSLALVPAMVAPIIDPTPTQSIRLAAAAKLTTGINLQAALGAATVLASAIKGFEEGGVVGGNSFSGDNVLARVNSGEMILNREQQAQLFEQANGGGSNSGGGDIVVQIDGEEVFRAVSRQVAQGGVLGEGGV